MNCGVMVWCDVVWYMVVWGGVRIFFLSTSLFNYLFFLHLVINYKHTYK